MTSFAEIQAEFDAIVGATVYATMVTVDARNRPRTRVLIPIWESVDGRPLGWLATYRTPVKAAHLAGNPHTSFSYWKPGNNSVAIDAVARWVDDLDVRRRVWDLYRATSPGAPGTTWATSGARPPTPSCTSCASTPSASRSSAAWICAAASGRRTERAGQAWLMITLPKPPPDPQ